MPDKIINRILAAILVATIFVMGGVTTATHMRNLGYAALVSYTQYMPENGNAFDSISARIQSFTNTFNNILLGKSAFERLNTQLQLSTGKQMLSFGDKTMVRLKTGQLYDLMDACDVTGELDKMARMRAYLDERDIPFLFVYAHTGLYEDGLLPVGAEDYNIAVADDIVDGLRQRGIDTLDSRAVMRESGLPLDKVIFNTDSHWNIYTAFTMYAETAKWLRDNANLALDENAISWDSYDVDVRERLLMGSLGRRVGDRFVTPDDFPVITPRYDTDILRNLSENDAFVQTRGTFAEAVLNLSELAPEDGGAYADCYDTYGYHRDVVYYTNYNAENGRVLVIKDSYGTPVSSFLALAAREVCAIDLRKGRISAEDFIESFKPDAVVIVHCQEMLRGKNYAFVD